MEPTADLFGSDAAISDPHPSTVKSATTDVPSLLAGHIGDLYAEEERLRRRERTELMIRRAESHSEA